MLEYPAESTLVDVHDLARAWAFYFISRVVVQLASTWKARELYQNLLTQPTICDWDYYGLSQFIRKQFVHHRPFIREKT